jgi:5-methyltetrahydropteroyltriglutamate--homocysteine methyltransferase
LADRILTTHTGSLPRPDSLVRLMYDAIEGKPVDADALRGEIDQAVTDVVRRQIEVGLDVVSDGEMSKPGFNNYIHERFSGFDGSAEFSVGDLADFPALAARLFDNEAGAHIRLFNCVGPVELVDKDAVLEDIARFKAALGDSEQDGFMNAVTPGQISFNHPNKHYGSHEEYLEATANAMSYEYRAITDAGLMLQLDSPDLAMAQHFVSVGSDLPDYHTHLAMAIEALNVALEGIDPARVRLHVCWGNYGGPHHLDVPMAEIVHELLKARVGYLVFEAANPRHAHEWEVFEQVTLPDDLVLVPGCIDVQTNRVEHPRLVAQRLERFADIVGPERVVGGTDCGLGTFVGTADVEPEVGWMKLASLVEGARLASSKFGARAS